jgi:predicted Zn-dependent protease
MMKQMLHISLFALIGIMVGWSSATGFKLGDTLKKATDTVSGEVEIPNTIVDQLGALMYHIKTGTCELEGASESRDLTETVWKKLIRSAPQSKLYASADADKWKWDLTLVNDLYLIDAEAFPGGKIIIYKGACAVSKNNQDRMAFVISHEMAHALERHAKTRFDKRTKNAIMTAAAGGTLNAAKLDSETTIAVMGAMGVSFEMVDVKPFSKKQELEADVDAMMLMAQAGYDPHAAIDFLNEMQAVCKNKKSNIQRSAMDDHPPLKKRLANLEAQLPEAMKIYEKQKG